MILQRYLRAPAIIDHRLPAAHIYGAGQIKCSLLAGGREARYVAGNENNLGKKIK
jgi:hypothetical protein